LNFQELDGKDRRPAFAGDVQPPRRLIIGDAVEHVGLRSGGFRRPGGGVVEQAGEVDYAIASGIFNIRLESSETEWRQYVTGILDRMNRMARKGIAFNMLTSYSDAEFMKAHLYYADPCFYFDYCKRNFSRSVALLHDYGLYDFTILVRK